MDKVDFDKFHQSYEDEMSKVLAVGGQSHDFYMQVKVDRMLDYVVQEVGAPDTLRFLDVGCGVGLTDKLLVSKVGSLTGIDIAQAAVERAQSEIPEADFQVFDGKQLPFEEGSFDVLFIICVLHHIAVEERQALFHEMHRVLAPGGALVIFEHNQLNPLTLRAVNQCPFDEDAVLLPQKESRTLLKTAGFHLSANPYILFTPFATAFFRMLDEWLGWLPLGAQYMAVGRKKELND